ncbi:hypothetical protein B0H12DRAFT_1077127 [Mycena haematopus]|nr:hypothetical protein B0H12DRAFT_1077127 [Mycena haematopus]
MNDVRRGIARRHPDRRFLMWLSWRTMMDDLGFARGALRHCNAVGGDFYERWSRGWGLASSPDACCSEVVVCRNSHGLSDESECESVALGGSPDTVGARVGQRLHNQAHTIMENWDNPTLSSDHTAELNAFFDGTKTFDPADQAVIDTVFHLVRDRCTSRCQFHSLDIPESSFIQARSEWRTSPTRWVRDALFGMDWRRKWILEEVEHIVAVVVSPAWYSNFFKCKHFEVENLHKIFSMRWSGPRTQRLDFVFGLDFSAAAALFLVIRREKFNFTLAIRAKRVQPWILAKSTSLSVLLDTVRFALDNSRLYHVSSTFGIDLWVLVDFFIPRDHRFGIVEEDLIWSDSVGGHLFRLQWVLISLSFNYLRTTLLPSRSNYTSDRYFASRIYRLTREAMSMIESRASAWGVYVIVLLAVVQMAAGLAQTIWSYHLRSYSKLDQTKARAITTLQTAASLACDLAITGFLCVFLHQNKPGLPRTEKLMNTLMLNSVNCGMLTALSSAGTMILVRPPDIHHSTISLSLAPSFFIHVGKILVSFKRPGARLKTPQGHMVQDTARLSQGSRVTANVPGPTKAPQPRAALDSLGRYLLEFILNRPKRIFEINILIK